MTVWKIYHKDGSILADANGEEVAVHGLEYSDSWMNECFLTIDFKNNAPINFAIGDWINYRGERFELNYDPGKMKQARLNTYGEGFVYDGVKFNSLQDELSRCEFLDVVLSDNQLHYTALPKFSFYVETVDDLLDRIQANLDEQIGKGKWKIFSRSLERSRQRGVTDDEWNEKYGSGTERVAIDSKSITVDSKNCWEALALVNTEWDLNFVVVGRNIYVETEGKYTSGIFKYGLGNGLYEVDQNADSDQSIITRLRAYGSEKNLPDHYYADLGSTPFLNVTGDYATSSTANALSVMLENSIYDGMWTNVKSDNGSNLRHVIVSCKIDDYSFDAELELVKAQTPYCTTRLLVENNKTASDAVKAKIDAGFKQIMFISGAKVSKFDSNRINYVKDVPNNMAISRLMLPGFPKISLKEFWDSLTDDEKKYVNPSGREHVFSTDKTRPYIDSTNLEKIGLRSGSQFFDTDDKTNGIIEIYPTIEEMEINGVRIDEIYKGSEITDDGRFDDGETVKNFDIYLNPAIDFDINDLRDDDFTISMKDGMCGGRDFKVASATKVDGMWRLTLQRVKDDALGLYFPYKDFQINGKSEDKDGDHFVLTGIELPDSYVRAASLKLLKYAIALLDKNDYTRYVYQPKVDEIFMARQHDAAMADTTGKTLSYHDTLKAGDIMRIKDDDLGIDSDIFIDQLVIKEEDGSIPTYEITLREDKEVGTIEKIQNQITSLQVGTSSVNNATIAQIKSMIPSEGAKYFLSKLANDTAKGTITFEKLQKFLSDIIVYGVANLNGGANIGNDYSFGKDGNVIFNALHSYDYENADQEGYAVEKDGNGKYHQYISNLTVWGKMHINELEINKLSYAGGSIYLSGAGNKIVKCVPVVYYDEDESEWYEGDEDNCVGWKCYLLADNGEAATENHWKVGDQVRCQTMGEIKSGGTYEDASNKSYWRTILENGVSAENECIESKNGQYLYDGQKFAWIVIGKHSSSVDGYNESNAPEGTRDYPSDGDVIVLDGSRTDSDRQNVLILESVGDYAPRIVGLSGVNTYSHDDKDVVTISPKGVKIKSSYFKLISESNENVIIHNYRGLFSPQFQYHVGDQVSYNNAIWTCIKDCWQIEPNKDNATYWQRDVYGETGEKGDSGVSYTIVPTCGVIRVDKDGKFILSDGVTPDINDTVTIDCTLYKTENGTQTKEKYAWWQATPTEALSYAYMTDTATIHIKNTFTSVKVDVYNCYLDSVSHRPTKGDTLLATLTIPVVKDGANGQNGQDGSSFKVLGTAEKHFTNKDNVSGALVPSKQYLFDDTSGLEDGVAAPCVATYIKLNNSAYLWMICKSDEGDSYMIGDDLWTNSGTAWLDIGSVKGVSIKQTSITYAISDSATTAPTSGWQSSVPATSASSPYLWTKVEVTYSDNTKTTSYSVSRQGTNGDDGKDALEIIVSPDTILLEADENGLVSDYSNAKSTITCRRGGKDVTSKCIFSKNSTNCESSISGSTVSITYVARQKLSDGKTEVSYPSGGVLVQIADTEAKATYLTQVKFIVNVAKYTGELLLNDKEFAVRMEKMSTQIGELPTKENVNQIVSTEISSSATTIKAEAVKQTKDDMQSAGLEITSDGVTLYGDKITINNGEKTVALFQDGKINVSLIDADNIEVKHLWAKNSSGTKVGYFGNTEEDACKIDDNTLAPLFVGGNTAKTSPFYVTSEGAMYASSGKIGYFSISSNGELTYDDGHSTAIHKPFVLSKEAMYFSHTTDNESNDALIWVGRTRHQASYANAEIEADIWIDERVDSPTLSRACMLLSAQGYRGDDTDYAGNLMGNFAIYALKGTYAGFRPAVRIAKKSLQLTDMDSVIFVPVTGITLTLPNKPQMGQYYKFIQGAGGKLAFYIKSNNYPMRSHTSNEQKLFDSGAYNQTTELIFVGDHWRVNWF